MDVRSRILAGRILEKINRNPSYSKKLGLFGSPAAPEGGAAQEEKDPCRTSDGSEREKGGLSK